MQTTPTATAGPVAAGEGTPVRRCANCGTALLGEHCHLCGQPVRGLVRHFSSIIGDFLDSVFELDSRILNTIGPLFFRPGRLSTEYFAGRRVRYVSPVRLFVFLSIITFFVARLSMSFGDGDSAAPDGTPAPVAGEAADTREVFEAAESAEAVEALRVQRLDDLAAARRDAGALPGVGVALDAAERAVNRAARARLAQLDGSGEEIRGSARLPDAADGPIPIRFGNGDDWNATTNPLVIDGLPEFANAWLNRQIGRGQKNMQRIRQDPDAYKDAILGAIPTMLFVLLPIFALMLKLAYAFKHRLYMEHLIVALHSHAFICVAILALLVTYDLQAWLGPKWPLLDGALSWVLAAIHLWIPLYLLIAQKRIYQQGWPMTLLKYLVIGNIYLVLLSLAIGVATVTSLVWM